MTPTATSSPPQPVPQPTLGDLAFKLDRLTELVSELLSRMNTAQTRRRRRHREMSEVAGVPFTKRQRDVLIEMGNSSGNIASAARELGINPSVAWRHYQRAIRKAEKAGLGRDIRRASRGPAPSRAVALPADKLLSKIDGEVICSKQSLSRQGIGQIGVACE